MQDLLIHPPNGSPGGNVPADAGKGGGSPAAPLVEVLWRRRWWIALAVVCCAAAAGTYLLLAAPVYRASAKVIMQQNGPRAFLGGPAAVPSETFLETQRDVLRSSGVLARAVQGLGPQRLETFDGASGDPVGWLQAANGFDVEPSNKSDVIVVSMESRQPDEAVRIVDAVVRAYLAELSDRERAAGTEMVRVLRRQREELARQRDGVLRTMVDRQRASGVLSFRTNDNGNIVLQRVTALAAALAAAEAATADLRAERQAVAAAMQGPESAAAYVQALQFKSRDAGDREYDDLRAQAVEAKSNQVAIETRLGPAHPAVQTQRARVRALKDRVAEKERLIVLAQAASVSARLAAAEEREHQLRTDLAAEQGKALDLVPGAAEYAALEADAAHLQKQCEGIDVRIAEVTANSIEARPPNADVLEWARVGPGPVKPRKGLTLLAAVLAGWVLGAGLAVLREWQDARVRTPEEVLPLSGAPVLATIPRMNPNLSPAARGQVVHLDPYSPAAEAYRSIRMSLSAGAAREARIILIASPTSGDGKSITAANLAIALAHAGHHTLLLDCDQRQPVQHLIFEPDGPDGPDGDGPGGNGHAGGFGDRTGAAGLTGVLAGEVKLRAAVRPTHVPQLYLLPCGPVPANPSELLAGKRFEQLLEALAETFDRIVVDSPPLGAFSDACSLAMLADATLLVLRMNHSPRNLAAAAVDVLDRAGVKVAGVVANDVPFSRGRRKFYAYDGAWQYAAAAGRLAPAARRQLAAAGVVAGALDATRRAPAAARAEIILGIEEPDWSIDVDPHHFQGVVPPDVNDEAEAEADGDDGRLGFGNGEGNGQGNGQSNGDANGRRGGAGNGRRHAGRADEEDGTQRGSGIENGQESE